MRRKLGDTRNFLHSSTVHVYNFIIYSSSLAWNRNVKIRFQNITTLQRTEYCIFSSFLILNKNTKVNRLTYRTCPFTQISRNKQREILFYWSVVKIVLRWKRHSASMRLHMSLACPRYFRCVYHAAIRSQGRQWSPITYRWRVFIRQSDRSKVNQIFSSVKDVEFIKFGCLWGCSRMRCYMRDFCFCHLENQSKVRM